MRLPTASLASSLGRKAEKVNREPYFVFGSGRFTFHVSRARVGSALADRWEDRPLKLGFFLGS